MASHPFVSVQLSGVLENFQLNAPEPTCYRGTARVKTNAALQAATP